jgi:hypothetical protein
MLFLKNDPERVGTLVVAVATLIIIVTTLGVVARDTVRTYNVRGVVISLTVFIAGMLVIGLEFVRSVRRRR